MPSRIREAERHLLDAGEQALRIIAEDLLGRAGKLVLEDEGTLAGSGHVEPEHGVERSAGGRRQVRVVYATPYAARRHEETHGPVSGAPIVPSIPGRQPKWLETPLKAMAPRYRAALEAAIRRAL